MSIPQVNYREALEWLITEGFVSQDVAREACVNNPIGTPSVEGTQTWQQAVQLTDYLNELMEQNGFRASNFTKNSIGSVEKLLRIDKRTVEEVRDMINWSQGHDFWSTVIRSTIKLRKHYDTMYMQRSKDVEKKLDLMISKPMAKIIPETYYSEWPDEIAKRHEEGTSMPAGFKDVFRKSGALFDAYI